MSFKELIELQYHTKDKFSNSTNLSDFGFYYFSNPGPTCGTHSQENTVNLYCSFGVDNDAIGDVTKLLGIEQPKGNGPDCGIYFGQKTGFIYRCGFSVDKLYKNRINTELGLNNKGYQK